MFHPVWLKSVTPSLVAATRILVYVFALTRVLRARQK
jgi:hypothetical protein